MTTSSSAPQARPRELRYCACRKKPGGWQPDRGKRRGQAGESIPPSSPACPALSEGDGQAPRIQRARGNASRLQGRGHDPESSFDVRRSLPPGRGSPLCFASWSSIWRSSCGCIRSGSPSSTARSGPWSSACGPASSCAPHHAAVAAGNLQVPTSRRKPTRGGSKRVKAAASWSSWPDALSSSTRPRVASTRWRTFPASVRNASTRRRYV